MKKILIIGALIAVAALSFAGFAYAQADTPPEPPYPAPGYGNFGGGMMDGFQGGGRGMMGRRGGFRSQAAVGDYGPMHEYMIETFAEALELEPEEIESRLAEGETMWQIAESLGISIDEFGELMLEARTDALEAAVDNGIIPQEQADWMLERMNQTQASGYGPGSANCEISGGRGPAYGGSPRGRWNSR